MTYMHLGIEIGGRNSVGAWGRETARRLSQLERLTVDPAGGAVTFSIGSAPRRRG